MSRICGVALYLLLGVNMEKYIINGGNKLYGSVDIQAAKNSVLPILAATVLTDDKVAILKIPEISDVKNMIKILSRLEIGRAHV